MDGSRNANPRPAPVDCAHKEIGRQLNLEGDVVLLCMRCEVRFEAVPGSEELGPPGGQEPSEVGLEGFAPGVDIKRADGSTARHDPPPGPTP